MPVVRAHKIRQMEKDNARLRKALEDIRQKNAETELDLQLRRQRAATAQIESEAPSDFERAAMACETQRNTEALAAAAFSLPILTRAL